MGQRLAVEVKNFVNTLPGKVTISFICHSMGGLVVRAALPYLSFYKKTMGNFISVCSPHTGYIFHTSMLVRTGLWVMNKMQNCECLKEMCCEDTGN
jgi:triacylglycerol esterase/lipase EstA (alpha/beta hydrolase family)